MVHELQFKFARMGWEYTSVEQELGVWSPEFLVDVKSEGRRK